MCDAGSRLLFKFRSGTHGLNEELGRHRGREGKMECSLCGDECENVSHVLWEYSAYNTGPNFMTKLQELLEDDYVDFESLDNIEKSSYVLGSELWESKFDGLLSLVRIIIIIIIDVWEIYYNYDSDSGPGQQLHSQSSPGDLAVVEGHRNGKLSQNCKLAHSYVRVTKGNRLYESQVRDH